MWLTVSRIFFQICGVKPSVWVMSKKRSFSIDCSQFCIYLRIINFALSSIRFSSLPPSSKTTRFLNICTTRFPKEKSPFTNFCPLIVAIFRPLTVKMASRARVLGFPLGCCLWNKFPEAIQKD
jgi:hypothetical protein